MEGTEVQLSGSPNGWREGWVTVDKGLPGWESHTVEVKAAIVDGEPRVTGLRVTPHRDDADAVLTGYRLRALPITALAAPVYGMANLTPVVPDRLHEIQREVASRPRKGRNVTTVEQVAEVYRLALASGSGKPRAKVCEVLLIGERTADRYIAQARRDGLIPGYRGQGGTRTTSEEEQA
jgi:hypothetical protein